MAVEKYGFLGMNILQLSVDYKNKKIKEPKRDVAYTGNHDNDSISGWFESLSENRKRLVRKIFGIGRFDDVNNALISAVMKSDAPIKIIPIQDYLGMGSEGRMNIPATVGGSWLFRVKKEDLNDELAEKIKKLCISI